MLTCFLTLPLHTLTLTYILHFLWIFIHFYSLFPMWLLLLFNRFFKKFSLFFPFFTPHNFKTLHNCLIYLHLNCFHLPNHTFIIISFYISLFTTPFFPYSFFFFIYISDLHFPLLGLLLLTLLSFCFYLTVFFYTIWLSFTRYLLP